MEQRINKAGEIDEENLAAKLAKGSQMVLQVIRRTNSVGRTSEPAVSHVPK